MATDVEYLHRVVETRLEEMVKDELFAGTEEEYQQKLCKIREVILESMQE